MNCLLIQMLTLNRGNLSCPWIPCFSLALKANTAASNAEAREGDGSLHDPQYASHSANAAHFPAQDENGEEQSESLHYVMKSHNGPSHGAIALRGDQTMHDWHRLEDRGQESRADCAHGDCRHVDTLHDMGSAGMLVTWTFSNEETRWN